MSLIDVDLSNVPSVGFAWRKVSVFGSGEGHGDDPSCPVDVLGGDVHRETMGGPRRDSGARRDAVDTPVLFKWALPQ